MTINKAIDVMMDSIPETAPDTLARKEVTEAYGMAIKVLQMRRPERMKHNLTHWVCPNCEIPLDSTRYTSQSSKNKVAYCIHCGQAIRKEELKP